MPCESLTDIVPVDYLVSSGLLIPMAVLDRVGGMREELFIDYVDIEWGLRAGAAGYRSFGVCGAFMNHQLGETPISFMGKPRPVHTPLRHYYAVRNGIWMYFQPFPPFNWKVRDAYRLALKFMFYCLMTKRRGSHFRMMALGIWHGLLGRMGSIDDATGKVSGSP
jgi:rhamnosyltransferase